MRTLIIEDEPKTGDDLEQGLADAGLIVDLVRDGSNGLHRDLTEAYDLAPSRIGRQFELRLR